MKPALFRKWVPAALASAVIAAFSVGASVSADMQVTLEPKTPQQLVQMIADSEVSDFSADVHTAMDLGIPQLPDPAGSGMAETPGALPSPHAASPPDSVTGIDSKVLGMLSMLSGRHEAKVYVDGPDKARFQVIDGVDEQNFIRNGATLWRYDSAGNTAVHSTVPELALVHAPHESGMPATPGDVVDRLLEAMGPHTDMSVQAGSRIAGRDAYTLNLVPRSGQSLVAQVSVGVDSATGVPLEVVVNAVGQQTPAVVVGFTSFTPETPEAALFDFTPPAGAEIREHELAPHSPEGGDGARPHAANPGGHDVGGIIKGTGWDTVLVVPADEVPEGLANDALLRQLSTPVENGRLLHTSLLNVLITADGRMAIGAVSLDRLQAAANGQ